MKPFLPGLIAFACAGGMSAQIEPSPPTPRTTENPFVFSIVPKAFQRNPRVDFNVITEMTEEGRRAPQPTREQPIRYLTKPAGFLQLGHGASAGEKPPAVERLEFVLERALAASGFLRAEQDHPPSLVIIYSWGSHSNPLVDDDPENNTVPNRVLIDEMIERARLVGGNKFATEFVEALATRSSPGLRRPDCWTHFGPLRHVRPSC